MSASRRPLLILSALILVVAMGLSLRPRALAADFVVTSANDSGAGTLRDAIEQANTTPGADTITFDLTNSNRIDLLSTITITDVLTIDGTLGTSNLNLNGDSSFPLLDTQSDVTIREVQFVGGRGISHSNGTLTVESSLFRELNEFAIDASSGLVNLTDVQFTDIAGSGVNAPQGGVTMTDVSGRLLTGPLVSISANSLSLTDVTVRQSSSEDGIIFVDGTGTLTTAENIQLLQNTIGTTGRGALTIDTSSGTTMTINRAIFSENDTNPSIVVNQGTVALNNSQIINGTNGSGGLQVGTNGSVTLSFTTIAGNSGVGLANNGTVSAKNVLIAQDTCTGNAITIKDRNLMPAGTNCITTTFDGNALQINEPPAQIVVDPADPPLFYSLEPTSPAIDRALDCNTFGGTILTVDSRGSARPERANCDIGGYELAAGSITAGRFTATIDQPNLPLEEANPATTQRDIDIQLNTYPIVPVTLSLTNQTTADCRLLIGGSEVATDTLTFNSSNWDEVTPADFQVEAIDDNEREGDHTCDIAIAFDSVTGTDGVYTTTAYSTTLQIDITDNDLVEKPLVDFDFSALAGITFQETNPLTEQKTPSDPVRVRIALDNPPQNDVKVWLVSEQTVPQCQFSANSEASALTLNASNWQDGVLVSISVIDDGIYEPSATECRFRGEALYFDNTDTNSNSQSAPVDPDPVVNVETQNDIPSNGLLEGETGVFFFELLPEISDEITNPSQFILDVSISENEADCAVGSGTPPTSQKTFQTTIDQRPGDIEVSVLAIADGVNELDENDTCTFSFTLRSPDGTTVLRTSNRTINIRELATSDNVTVQVFDRTNGANERLDLSPNDPYQAGPLQELTSSGVSLALLLNREISDTVDVTIRESDNSGLPGSGFFSQCLISVNGNAGASSVNITLTDTDEQEIFIFPQDDPYIEGDGISDPHYCDIQISRNPESNDQGEILVSRYRILIDDTFGGETNPDNDVKKIFIIPEMPTSADENTSIVVTYGNTTAFNEPTAIIVDNTTTGSCTIRDFFTGAPLTSGFLGLIGSSENDTSRFRVELNEIAGDDEQCFLRAYFDPDEFPIPSNYQVPVGTNYDSFVPDVRINIFDVSAQPTTTPLPEGTETGPTPLATSQGDLTLTPGNPGANVEPIPTEIPIPSVSLKEDVNVLPVRTGPYLGATFVTIAVRETPSGEPEFYRVLARSNDETADVTWFKIVANGKVGWASGLSLDLNNITEPELAVEGSIFDQIENVPNLGVQGTILRERVGYRRPSTRAALNGLFVPEGATVSIIGRTREFPYDDWYQVRYNGQTGWILSESRLEDPAIEVNADQVRELVPVR